MTIVVKASNNTQRNCCFMVAKISHDLNNKEKTEIQL